MLFRPMLNRCRGMLLCGLSLTSLLAFSPNALYGQDGAKLDLAGGKMSVSVPASWKKVEPKSSIIQYEFKAPIDAKEDQQARVTVMSAGGSIQANIDRWKQQFEIAKEADAKVEKKEVAGQTVHMVDLKGTFKESMGGPFSGGPTKKLQNHRMLGLIIESKNAGTVFFKMTGPNDVVEKELESWKKMVDTLVAK